MQVLFYTDSLRTLKSYGIFRDRYYSNNRAKDISVKKKIKSQIFHMYIDINNKFINNFLKFMQIKIIRNNTS